MKKPNIDSLKHFDMKSHIQDIATPITKEHVDALDIVKSQVPEDSDLRRKLSEIEVHLIKTIIGG